MGARNCFTVCNGFDPDVHHPVAPAAEWRCDLVFLAHALPDRQQRFEDFFVRAALACRDQRFLLAGEGWGGRELPANVHTIGYVAPRHHNRLNCSARLVLNINRDAMAATGYAPPTRVFEAAGAAAAVVTDAWAGVDTFFEPVREILVVNDGADLADLLRHLSPADARALGRRMRARALADHTYAHRAQLVDAILHGALAPATAVGQP